MKKSLLTLLIALLSAIALFSVEKDDIVGLWYMQEHEGDRGVAEVFAHNEKYYAVAIAYESYLDTNAIVPVPPKDVNNPDPSLRNRTLNEVIVINEISFNGKKWTDGEIYDPASGKAFYLSGTLKDGNLVWKGSIDKLGLFGAKTTWTRVEKAAIYAPYRKTIPELIALIPNKDISK